jgi:hypothetical protein
MPLELPSCLTPSRMWSLYRYLHFIVSFVVSFIVSEPGTGCKERLFLFWAWFRSSVYDFYNWECGVGTPRAGSCRVQAARGRAPSASFVKMASPQSEPCPFL